MRSVLWVTAIPPDYRSGGGPIRQAHLIDALAQRAAVHLVVAGKLEDVRVRSHIASLTEVPAVSRVQVDRGPRRTLRHLRQALVARYPAEVEMHSQALRHLRPIVESRQGEVDVVCVEFEGLAPLLPPRRAVPFSITLHSLLSGMAEQARAIAPRRRQWFYELLEQRKARRLEQWTVNAYDHVVAVSQEDADALGGQVSVVPNGVDTSAFMPTPLPASRRIVMTGAFYTLPNIDGARWFCEEVLPIVRARTPDAEVDLVGRDPLPEVQALEALAGVRVHRDVPSMTPYLERARVTIAPLRIGTGTRLKVLEALAAGRPVVGTTLGLDGLGLIDGEHALFADTPQEFADAVRRVLEDDELSLRLAVAGRRHVEGRFAWDVIGARFSDLLAKARVRGSAQFTSPGGVP